MEHTNNLIHSTSPYLLQHAHNPVNWNQWSEEIIAQAQKENKLVLVSIGYAACHWCHVMEHESFEDTAVARVMNEHYVCIKVDREERPDVDHYYMSAVQLMGQQGGWPLNIIALPDGRPIWGGTYFTKETWIKNLKTVAEFYKQNEEKTTEYGEQLQEGIEQVSLITEVENRFPINSKLLVRGVESWKQRWDMKEGGNAGSPKFPMPVNLEFLLYYGFIKNDNKALEFVHTTLGKMARGGIYDQVGGGFARYSVDDIWKVPHFEKMLYDNGQLLSIYSKGYQQFKNEEFKRVVYETADFLERELMDKSGAFYSSLDADSEGEEGKFYVWNERELQQLIGADYPLFADYFQVNKKGFWEQGNTILLRNGGDENFAAKRNLTAHQLQIKVSKWKFVLLKERENRIRPGLDDKTLTSWNALAIQGLLDAYKAFKDEHFLKLAIKNATFLKDSQLNENGKLYHNWKAGTRSIEGFLEDYALLIQAYISMFEITGDDIWLALANKLTEYTTLHFYDERSGLFYFSEKISKSVVTNHFQKEDNVIPAANSVMANNLHRLYLLNGTIDYKNMISKMLHHITPHFSKYPMAYANWGTLMLKQTEPYFEVAVCGINSNILLNQLQVAYLPNVLWAHTNSESAIPLLENRFQIGDDLIYICREGVCQLPVKSADEALELISKHP
ncbi:thioredoxin domain-containing protein [Prolixibacteraceae bacterium Z1-6]|uniref:Thioredoxin domain-containing protein n=2 Tax=Draconibacterium aestuarii TaxID=2998507 RepID=A0A9X3F9H5_9BACT|nr:thioredoxin domain-containing protein [Prolixibacteraceae bacterium Z1-6]